jgi:ubiquinone/menaquinone biosynthesis C-methylase UbiE
LTIDRRASGGGFYARDKHHYLEGEDVGDDHHDDEIVHVDSDGEGGDDTAASAAEIVTKTKDGKIDRKYEKVAFWDDRYKKDAQKTVHTHAPGEEHTGSCCWHDGEDEDNVTKEWYYGYEELKPLLAPYLDKFSRKGKSPVATLDLGCGLSDFFGDMHEDGYEGKWVGVDFSAEACRMMTEKFAELEDVRFEKLDVRDMHPFENETFDVVVDKATADAIACDKDKGREMVAEMFSEVSRVLKPGGVYVIVSLYSPETEDEQWFLELLVSSMLDPATGSEKSKGDKKKRRKREADNETQAPDRYKMNVTVHSPDNDDDGDDEEAEAENTMSHLPHVYIVQKCGRPLRANTSSQSDMYTVNIKVH